jgi:hypothetical protein
VKVPNKMKRDQKRKARRLAAAEAQKRVATTAIRECHVQATRQGDMIYFQTRTGYFSPRVGPVFSLHELEIADALDNPNALVECCMKAGIAVLAGCLRTPVMGKPGKEALTALADAAAKWLKIDVEALKKEIAEERNAQAKHDAAGDAPEPAQDPSPAAGTEPPSEGLGSATEGVAP